jgi:PhnB protein
MRVNPHLSFDGQCEAAFRLYEGCLGGHVTLMLRYAETPMAAQLPVEWHSKIIHATLTAGDLVLTGADAWPSGYLHPQGIFVLLHLDEPEEAERIFATFADGGQIQMPLQETFWAQRFGMLEDRFGIPWHINCSKPIDAGR